MTTQGSSVVKSDELTYRGAEKTTAYKWETTDKPGEFMMIDKNQLEVDHSYQRDKISQRKVLELASAWSWIACGALSVAMRAGKVYVMEGQYRLLAARKRADIKQMPCIVFETQDNQEEAIGFLRANTNRKPISSLDRFKAQVVTDDKAAVMVERLVRSAGRNPGDSGAMDSIRCMTTMMRWARRKPDELQKIWPLIHSVCTGHPIHGRIVDGLMYIETHLPAGRSLANRKEYGRVLAIGYSALIQAAQAASVFYGNGGAKVSGTGMLKRINHGSRTRIELNNADSRDL